MAIVEDICDRIIGLLQKRGFLSAEFEALTIDDHKLADIAPSLAVAQKASTIHYIALGEREFRFALW